MQFLSRLSAGGELAAVLRPFVKSDPVVLALPRGGVVVAAEVTRILRLPLDLILVHKIGHPSNPEFAVGAIAENAKPVYDAIDVLALDDEWREDAEKAARQRIFRRRQLYFAADFIHPSITGKPVIVVDDGMATGLTMLAAVSALRAQHPRQIIAAVPVASRPSIDLLINHADVCIVLDDPNTFRGAVGMHYDDFPQVDDNNVKKLLGRSIHDELRKTTAINP